MQTRHLEAIIFSAKAAIAAVASVVIYNFSGLTGPGWAAISAVLVIQPNLHSSFKASLTRVIANLVGAFGGAALLVIIGHTLPALAIGILLTGLICHWLKADDAVRPAFAAVVIVIFSNESGKWDGPRDRVIAVIIGCACALAVGFLFDKFTDAIKLNDKETEKTAKSSE